MATINSVTMVGRLGFDPQVKPVGQTTVARISIGTVEKIRSKTGEMRDEWCNIDCTLWGEEAIRAQKYLTKGKAIAVTGRLKEEKWTDKNTGMQRSKHVIHVDKVVYMEKMDPVDPSPQATRQAQQQIYGPQMDGDYEEVF